MTTLYSIGERYRNLEELLDNDEFPAEAVLEAAIAVEDEFVAKAQSIGRLVLNMNAEIKAFREEEDRLSRRRRTIQNKLEGLKNYLQHEMTLANLRKISGVVSIRIQTNSRGSVIIDNEKAIPAEYWIPQHPVLDKAVIYDRIKAGESVPGCHVETGEHLRIG